MNDAQIIDLIYHLSEEYLATNYSKDTNDIGYNLGIKDSIEGFRNFVRIEIMDNKVTDEYKNNIKK